jgi:hypothetical protein
VTQGYENPLLKGHISITRVRILIKGDHMSTAFITTITLIGNSNIHNLVKEIGVRYDQLLKDGYDSESMETVAKLFYGEDKGSNHPSYQEIRAKWICLEECDTELLSI